MRLLEANPEITQTIARLRDPQDPRFVDELRFVLEELVRKNRQDVNIVNGRLDIGHPSLTLTNGQTGNVFCSYVTVEVDTAPGLNAAIVFTHNLNVPLVGGGATGTTPNVIYDVVFIRHNGTGAGAATTTSVMFQAGDQVTPNSIELRVHSGLTVNDANPMTLTLRFYAAEEGAL